MQVLLKNQLIIKLIYGLIIVCFCITFGIGAFALTLEPDEVWMLMSTMKAFGIPLPLTSAVDVPVTTSGGLHFILHGLIAKGWSGNILFHRIVSVSFTIILLGIVFKLLESMIKDQVLAAAGTALFVTAPGFLLQASLATSEIVATTVFLLAALFWVNFGCRSIVMALLGGALFGLACATRMTCLSMLPTILLWSAFAHRGWGARLLYPLLATAVAVLVFIGFLMVYIFAFNDFKLGDYLFSLGGASGLGRSFDGILMRLNYLVVGDGIIPLMSIVALASWYLSRLGADQEEQPMIRLCGFLLIAGGGGWLAWLLKSPISHIRYLWPAIPMLWLVAILLSLSALHSVVRLRPQMLAHLAVILICALQGLLNVRMLAVGDSLALVYEVARSSKLGNGTEGFFVARNNQVAVAGLLGTIPDAANIYALVEQAAYPMTYLSGRAVKSLKSRTRASAEDYLVVLPNDRSIWLPKWDVIGWLHGNTTLVERRGEYELYLIHQNALLPTKRT